MCNLQFVSDSPRFKRHEHLARAGDCPEQIYRIEDGWACRYRMLRDGRRQIVSLFLPGDYCEPQWAFAPRADLPVVALTPLRATTIRLRDGGQAARRDWAEPMIDSLLQALNRQAEWIVSLGRRSATERIAALVYDVFTRMRATQRTSDDRCAMPLTQYDLADILGLTPVHVNRVLKVLRGRGLVELRRSTLRVPDPAALQRLAGE